MPIRLSALLIVISAIFLFLAFFNPEPVRIVLLPGFQVDMTLAVLLMGAFIAGVVSVFVLYFYDSIASVLASLKLSSGRRREEKIKSLYTAGREKLMMENLKDAKRLFTRAVSLDNNNVPSLIELGKIARMQENLPEAIKIHSKVMGLDESNLENTLELARDYTVSEQFANAVTTLERARVIAGRSVPPLREIREIFMKLRNWEEALKIQRTIVDLAPWDSVDAEKKLMAGLTYETADRKQSDGDAAAAKDLYRSVLRIDPSFVPAYLKLAEEDSISGWENDAITLLEKGFKVTGSIVILKFLESLLHQRGEPERAIAQLKWAKNVAPDNEAIGLLLAGAYLTSNDIESAKKEIESLNGSVFDYTLYHLIVGNIKLVEENMETAIDSFREAYNREAACMFHFTCTSCGQLRKDYAGRCKNCNSWNTLQTAHY